MDHPYHFMLTIGDVFGWNYEETVQYYVRSNKTIEEVREAHFNIRYATGINLHRIASTRESCKLMPHHAKRLLALGYSQEHIDQVRGNDLNTQDVAMIWLFLLMKADPELSLRFEEYEAPPELHFSGKDDQGRWMSPVGYGVLE